MGAPHRPMMSRACRSARYRVRSACSFQSASVTMRPCCRRTELKWRARSKVSRERSLFIDAFVRRTLGHVHEPRFEPEPQILGERVTQVGFALRLLEELERPHLGSAF